MRSLWRVLILVAAVPLAVVLGIGLTETLRGRAYAAEHIHIDGVGNAGQVNAHLYRGAQPSLSGFRALKARGVQRVVSLTLGPDDVSRERADVEALGMEYVHLPWSTTHDPPAAHIEAFVALLRATPERITFVHCKAGVDRTGVMVAAYRIAVDHWVPAQAIAEMDAFHFHYVFLPHLAQYVERLPSTFPQMVPSP